MMPPFRLRLHEGNERVAQALDTDPDYRVLRRLPTVNEIWCRSSLVPEQASSTKIAVIDTETTGLNSSRHKLIELAMVKMTVDDVVGDLLDITPPMSWLEDPNEPLSLKIERLTSLTDSDVAGQSFPVATIFEAFDDIDIIVAHNARFDAGFLAKRFPSLGHPWACSAKDINWPELGFEGGRGVGALLNSARYFVSQAHRAGPDAWSTACLLAMPAPDGRCIASHLLQAARRTTSRLYAIGAPYCAKDDLRAADYRWCSTRRAWWTEGDSERIGNEAVWLKALHPLIKPEIIAVDWFNRHRI
jgi:DNA polymerase III subunit epsilon